MSITDLDNVLILTIFLDSLLLLLVVRVRASGVAGPIVLFPLLEVLRSRRCERNEDVEVVDDVAGLVEGLGLTDVVDELAACLLLD